MGKIKFLVLAITYLMLFSCGDIEKSGLKANEKALVRGDGDCGYCDEITVQVNYSPNVDNCCKAEVLIKSTTGSKDCKQMIFINGEFLQFIDEDLTVLNYAICPGEPTVVRVMGFDDTTGEFTKICFEERLNCAGCCDNVSFDAYSCGKNNDTGCCDYTYTFYNRSTCPMYVYNAAGVPVLTLPINTSISSNFSACPNNPESLKYIIGKSETESCTTFALETNCAETCKCGTSSLLVKQLKNIYLRGCCRFALTAANRSNCTLYLFTDDGGIIATIAPGTIFKTTVEECFTKIYYLGSTPVAGGCGSCTSATIKCGK